MYGGRSEAERGRHSGRLIALPSALSRRRGGAPTCRTFSSSFALSSVQIPWAVQQQSRGGGSLIFDAHSRSLALWLSTDALRVVLWVARESQSTHPLQCDRDRC